MTQNAIQVWMGDVRGAEYGFLKAVTFALDEFKQKNNLPLYALISICNGKPFGTYKIIKGDKLVYAAPLRRILADVLSGIKIVFKNDQYAVKAESTQAGVNHDRLEVLRKLADASTRFQSEAFKREFPVIKKEDTRDNAAKIAAFKARAMKWAEEQGVSLEVLAHALTAKASNTVQEGFDPAH